MSIPERMPQLYESRSSICRANVKPERDKNHRETYRRLIGGIHGEARPAMRTALCTLHDFLHTCVSKHRIVCLA